MSPTRAVASEAKVSAPSRKLRLLSFNIQGGSAVHRYRQYVTRGYEAVLPHPRKGRNLRKVAELAQPFDFVALNEADGGSLRSGFINQVQFLAENAGFPYWACQPNRKVARLAEPSNGILSRIEPTEILDHRLPGRIPGRGALELRFGSAKNGLRVIVAHLALSPGARRTQLDYLAEVAGRHRYVVLMGDLNCTPESGELDRLYEQTLLCPSERFQDTFPSWRPRRAIDHILLSEGLQPLVLETLPVRVSDHLPIAVTVALPPDCDMT
jgi:endonuclease/exonuclease/phosphatase family metal-dependent hydrolase